MSGQVVKIMVAEKEGGSISALETAELHDGKGIVGDRYYGLSAEDNVTLIDQGMIDEVNAAAGWSLKPEEIRRNIVTTGIDLNQWETARFKVGNAILEEVELCEPCAILGKILQNDQRTPAEVVKSLTNKAGLRSKVIKGGTVSAGDAVSGV